MMLKDECIKRKIMKIFENCNIDSAETIYQRADDMREPLVDIFNIMNETDAKIGQYEIEGMKNEGNIICVTDIKQVMPDFTEGYGYEAHPTDTWYALDHACKCVEKLDHIEQIIEQHDADKIPEDYWFIDKIRGELNA